MFGGRPCAGDHTAPPPGAEGMPHDYHAHAHGNYLIHAYFGGYIKPTSWVYLSST